MGTLIAWIADRPVGELIRKPNGNLQFRYDPSYEGPPISRALPLQEEAHPHALVRAVFAGLLPEGDVRTALARNLGVSEGNDFALLEQVGGDVAGAISLLEEGGEPPSSAAVQALDDEQLARLLDQLPQRPLAADAEAGVRLSLAGAQAKLPVIIDEGGRMALPANSAAASTHILKPEPPRFPGLVDNEAFCMALANACALRAASTSKARAPSGLPYLVVERYDRELDAKPVARLHQEDFCQALGLPPERKYQQEGGPTFARSAELVRGSARAPAEDLPRLVRALAFNWIVGNCDAHGKNYSLLHDEPGPTLAPLYDVVCTVIYPELPKRMAMSIGRARQLDEVRESSWVDLATEAGLRPAFVTATVAELLERAREQARILARDAAHQNHAAQQITERIEGLALG